MKKAVLMLAAGGLMLVTPSCKKGENDPFLSLASRKSRLAGEYNITSYSTTETWESSGSTTTTTETLSGTTITTTETSESGGASTTETWTTTLDLGEMTFDKDGNFSMTWNTTEVIVDEDSFGGWTTTTTTTTVRTEHATGTWNFLGKVDTYKNKERIVINVLTVHETDQANSVTVTTDGTTSNTTTTTGDKDDNTYGFSDGEVSAVYEIDQLKGKEVILRQIGGGTNTYSTTDNSSTPSVTTTFTYTGTSEAWWTLTQK